MSRFPLRVLPLAFAIGGAIGVAGCGYTPQQLGITGPGTNNTAVASHATEGTEDAVIAQPGLQMGGQGDAAPSTAPSFGSNGRFYGYN